MQCVFHRERTSEGQATYRRCFSIPVESILLLLGSSNKGIVVRRSPIFTVAPHQVRHSPIFTVVTFTNIHCCASSSAPFTNLHCCASSNATFTNLQCCAFHECCADLHCCAFYCCDHHQSSLLRLIKCTIHQSPVLYFPRVLCLPRVLC